MHNLQLSGIRAVLLLFGVFAQAAGAEQEPIDVLREHIAAGIAVLNEQPAIEPTETANVDRPSQADRLCALAHNMFDMYAFSRLVLASHWTTFSETEQQDFINVFGDFLCRYYIGRLQAGYSNNSVEFLEQEFQSPTRAVVTVEVAWQDLKVPVEVRMVQRNKVWKAYDISIAGISGVLIYRAQFSSELARQTPAEVIEGLRRRIAEKA